MKNLIAAALLGLLILCGGKAKAQAENCQVQVINLTGSVSFPGPTAQFPNASLIYQALPGVWLRVDASRVGPKRVRLTLHVINGPAAPAWVVDPATGLPSCTPTPAQGVIAGPVTFYNNQQKLLVGTFIHWPGAGQVNIINYQLYVFL